MFARCYQLDDALQLKPRATCQGAEAGLRGHPFYLRIIDLIARFESGFAFPSQPLYFTRDGGLDPHKSAAALAEVQRRRREQKLPFLNFDLEFLKTYRSPWDYSAAASPCGRANAGKPPGREFWWPSCWD